MSEAARGVLGVLKASTAPFSAPGTETDERQKRVAEPEPQPEMSGTFDTQSLSCRRRRNPTC